MALETLDNQIDITHLSLETPETQAGEAVDLDKAITKDMWDSTVRFWHKSAASAQVPEDLPFILRSAYHTTLLNESVAANFDFRNPLKTLLIDYAKKELTKKHPDANLAASLNQIWPWSLNTVPISDHIWNYFIKHAGTLLDQNRLDRITERLAGLRLLNDEVRFAAIIDSSTVDEIYRRLIDFTQATENNQVVDGWSPRWSYIMSCWAQFRTAFPESFHRQDISPKAWAIIHEDIKNVLSEWAEFTVLEQQDKRAPVGSVQAHLGAYLQLAAYYKILTAERVEIQDGRISLVMPKDNLASTQAPPIPQERQF